jgi:hypothetical protein
MGWVRHTIGKGHEVNGVIVAKEIGDDVLPIFSSKNRVADAAALRSFYLWVRARDKQARPAVTARMLRRLVILSATIRGDTTRDSVRL